MTQLVCTTELGCACNDNESTQADECCCIWKGGTCVMCEASAVPIDEATGQEALS